MLAGLSGNNLERGDMQLPFEMVSKPLFPGPDHSVPMIHCVAFAAQYGGLLPTFNIGTHFKARIWLRHDIWTCWMTQDRPPVVQVQSLLGRQVPPFWGAHPASTSREGTGSVISNIAHAVPLKLPLGTITGRTRPRNVLRLAQTPNNAHGDDFPFLPLNNPASALVWAANPRPT